MDLAKRLEDARDDVIAEARAALGRAHLTHYEADGEAESALRLAALFDLVVSCLAEHSLVPVCEHAEKVARERFDAGYGIGEVQTAFNVLEEAIWHVVVTDLPAGDLAESVGLTGTVLGAGRDALARTWVSLASRRHVASHDLRGLFTGAGA